jgi:hypothetical protein
MIHYFYALARAIPPAHAAAQMVGGDMRHILQTPVSPAKAGAQVF